MNPRSQNSQNLSRKRNASEILNDGTIMSPMDTPRRKFQKVQEGDSLFTFHPQNQLGSQASMSQELYPSQKGLNSSEIFENRNFESSNEKPKKEKFREMIKECQYEVKFSFNPNTNRKNRILV